MLPRYYSHPMPFLPHLAYYSLSRQSVYIDVFYVAGHDFFQPSLLKPSLLVTTYSIKIKSVVYIEH